ncbi:NAD-dependent epimerase/dehydratase family protein [Blastococcus brunescens]|uniref:NAD-dependent epimerase/dehydratase family protein n=1 Tax=Blastococcus brunescens TaxID=1564165 RepID=A0ABZ1B7Y9_9ACTN|nr:NAD-dependent epimerase/dehydratase family protein [Blastococcus sp. BMG 8361]WRL65791.1 NAD-dependent epimerase/dehydratase family protein [Blastococcus sp. BMG 8361]
MTPAKRRGAGALGTGPRGLEDTGDTDRELTVAVTGPTGTFGAGLVPLLQDDDRIGRVIGIARRPFDPAERGWTKMEYRQGDVRDAAALEAAFDGVDVVVHLAFLITGNASRETTRSINVDGTLNAFRAAAAAGAQRFVYASSVAAYGFHADNPERIDEEWPTRPASRLFYAQEKAELEELLGEEARAHPDLALFLLRPRSCSGRTSSVARTCCQDRWHRWAGSCSAGPGGSPSPCRCSSPSSRCSSSTRRTSAGRWCSASSGPVRPGPTTSRARGPDRDGRGAGVRRPADPPAGRARPGGGPRVLPAALPAPAAEWVEAASRPAIMDTTKAREKLGWRPRYSGLEALRDTLDG